MKLRLEEEKKKKKQLSLTPFIKRDAGDVEANVAAFNHAAGSGEGQAMGESLNKEGEDMKLKENLNNVVETEEKSREAVQPDFADAAREIKENDPKVAELEKVRKAPEQGKETLPKDLKLTLDESLFREAKETTLKDICDKLKVISREDEYSDEVSINENNFAYEMRFKRWDVHPVDKETIKLSWLTQEPFYKEEGKEFREEVKRALKALARREKYEKPFKVNLKVEARDGSKYGHFEDQFDIEAEKYGDAQDFLSNPIDDKEWLKGQILEFPNGEYLTVDFKDGKLIAGNVTNGEVIPEFEIDYDDDFSADWNLEKLYDLSREVRPELSQFGEAIRTKKGMRKVRDLDEELEEEHQSDLVSELYEACESIMFMYKKEYGATDRDFEAAFQEVVHHFNDSDFGKILAKKVEEKITPETSLRRAVEIITPYEFQLDRVRDDITVKDIWESIKAGKNFYQEASVEGKGFDSDVRETIFNAIAEAFNIDYIKIYRAWRDAE